uniref:Rhodanese domain-containing protein n=1 Tax=Tetradesmus obliquus TaxID=3088 RepID=A0A383VMR1_TETOB|eukprot:jgi/Sobl393_1/12772/SZX66213.1
MPLKLINAGGSLTFSAVVLATLWAVKSIAAAARQRQNTAASSSTQQGGQASKYAFCITPTALAWLVQLQAVPYFVVDVRQADDVADNPLPNWLQGALHIPESQLAGALSAPFAAWTSAAAAAAATAAGTAGPDNDGDSAGQLGSLVPTPHHLLVLIAQNEQQQAAAAAKAAAAGYDRVAVLEGGASSLQEATQHAAAGEAAMQAQQILHRDALALLLDLAALPEDLYLQLSDSLALQLQQQQQQQQQQQPGSPCAAEHEEAAAADGPAASSSEAAAAAAVPVLQGRRVLVLDVRRHDERTLYGAIPGALHLPVDELPSALLLPASHFSHRYHFEQPGCGDVLVLQSRQSARAHWAAQLARDAGWKHVFVYAGGVRNWQLSLAVQAYSAYQQWQPPPDPEPFVPCQPDVAAGAAQLQQLGLAALLLEQHAPLQQYQQQQQQQQQQ